MSSIRWTPEAAEDLARIARHIRADNAETARRVAREIIRKIEELETFPRRGRKGHEEGTLELVLSPLPYVVVYRIHGAASEVLHIYHGAQNWIPD